MPRRQYEFVPEHTDPHLFADQQWSMLRDELNVTRQHLEASEAREIAKEELIKMLRRELAAKTAAHDADQIALTVMTTKLRTAGTLILDVLKIERSQT